MPQTRKQTYDIVKLIPMFSVTSKLSEPNFTVESDERLRKAALIVVDYEDTDAIPKFCMICILNSLTGEILRFHININLL